MNRKARRAEKAKAQKTHSLADIPIAAIHEAGHAVAKVLAIEELEWDLREAIADIEIHCDQSGVTRGHMFSRGIEEGSQKFKSGYLAEFGIPSGTDVRSFLTRVFRHGRNAGADIERWFRARTFDAVSGPVAEAIYSNQSFHQVWESDHAMGDRSSVASDALLADMPPEHVIQAIDHMAALSAHIMEKTSVWTAVLTLAKALPAVGRMAGSDAITCIASAIPRRERVGLFSDSLVRINEIEVAMHQARVAVACGPFSALDDLLKGKEIIQEAGHCGLKTVEAVKINCQRAISAETLWRAFGDGALRLGENEEVSTNIRTVSP
jgi:hypothetical protein